MPYCIRCHRSIAPGEALVVLGVCSTCGAKMRAQVADALAACAWQTCKKMMLRRVASTLDAATTLAIHKIMDREGVFRAD